MVSPWRCALLAVLLSTAVHTSSAKCARHRQDVRVDNCSGKVCILRKGHDTGITFTFRPDKPYRALKAKVTGKVFQLEVPFAGVPSDACKGLVQAQCPLKANEEYVYRTQIPVSRAYPAISNVGVKFLLVDVDTDEPVACALIRVNIRR